MATFPSALRREACMSRHQSDVPQDVLTCQRALPAGVHSSHDVIQSQVPRQQVRMILDTIFRDVLSRPQRGARHCWGSCPCT